MIYVEAPNDYVAEGRHVVFLAGSIEMGKAVEWQRRAAERLAPYEVVVLNPRRADWDSSWQQSPDDERFLEQVRWELDGLEAAHSVIVNFDPATRSPITLLEFGLCATALDKRIFVCCPPGFWRRGNVEIVCARYGLAFYEDFEVMMADLQRVAWA